MLDTKKWNELLRKARNGDSVAQNEVGNYYSEGYKNLKQKEIVKQNNKLAFHWYEKSAEQGNEFGINSLANHLDDGIGCDKNTKRAIELYKKAIKLGSSNSAFNLGTIYRDKGNYKKALEYYKLAMKMSNSDYSFKVGLCYYYGIGIKQDKIIGIKHFKKVSKDNQNIHTAYEQDLANYYIGLSYLTGEGLSKSLKLAKKYFELANIDNDNENALELTHLIGRNLSAKSH